MARIAVIGGSGHVGTYLIPKLVELGHKVISVSRGAAKPYREHFAWSSIETLKVDRKEEEKKGNFGKIIADLKADIVVDMIAFDLNSTRQITEALKGKVQHYLFCSSIWVYGNYVTVPSDESDPMNPIDAYGRGKAESEDYLLREARVSGFPATCFRPGHIVGEGWCSTTPQGNSNPAVFSRIARGEELALPNLGHEMLHHVHAEDVVRFIICAIENRAAAIGETFNVVSSRAVTVRGYAEAVFRWFDKTPKIKFLPFEEWLSGLEDEFRENSRGHIVRSSCHSIEKAQTRLGYQPRYSSLAAIHESVQAQIRDGSVTTK